MEYNSLEALLGSLQETMLGNMLEDLRDPSKRSPALYNAIIKELERNGINCIPKAGDGENALSKLMKQVADDFESEHGQVVEFRKRG